MQNENERRGGTSASNAEADLRCPGRHLAQKPFPEGEGGPDASHGRIIHAALAEPSANGAAILHSLTLEQRETFDRCREIERKFSLQIFPDQSGQKPLTVIREKRFWVMVDGKFMHSAKPDLVMHSENRGAIIEYKTLLGDVPAAPTNMQLRDQTVLAARNLKLNEIFCIVDQPLVTMTPEVVRYGPEDINRAEAEMFERVRRSNDPSSPRLAGAVQCEHCRAKLDCAEYNRFAGSMIPGMLSLLDVPVAAWTPEQRGMFCNQRGVAQKWLDQTEQAMKDGLTADPEFVAGWYLAPGAERRTVTDPEALFTRFAALGGTPQKFMRCVSVTLGKLKEALNDLTGARGKALETAINVLTEGLVETKQNAPSLKRKEK